MFIQVGVNMLFRISEEIHKYLMSDFSSLHTLKSFLTGYNYSNYYDYTNEFFEKCAQVRPIHRWRSNLRDDIYGTFCNTRTALWRADRDASHDFDFLDELIKVTHQG